MKSQVVKLPQSLAGQRVSTDRAPPEPKKAGQSIKAAEKRRILGRSSDKPHNDITQVFGVVFPPFVFPRPSMPPSS